MNYLKIVESYEQSLSSQIKKAQGIVYTPKFIINYLLDKTIALAPQNPKILDPACGTGNFLIEAINKLHQKGKPIKTIIEENIYGIDCDLRAINTLKGILQFMAGEDVKHNIYNANSLDKSFLQSLGKFDIVVGNPPYVRIQNINPNERKFLKDWKFTKGNTDLYVAFIELAFSIGDCIGYVVPSGFIKNKTSAVLNWLLENHYIEELVDFDNNQIFPKVTTYTCLLIGTKRSKTHFILKKACQVANPETININEDLAGEKKRYGRINGRTLLISSEHESFIYEMENRGPRLKDLVDIRVGLQTSADRIFFIRGDEEGDYINYKGYMIEKAVLRPCVKASKNLYGYIIFPYRIENSKAIPMAEEEICKGAYVYLLRYKEELMKRERGKLKEWWLYGRGQGLTTLFGKKLLIPSMMKDPKFTLCEDENLLYFSGYAMFGEHLDIIKKALETDLFKKYMMLTSKNFKSGWKACSKYLIENFSIPSSLFPS